MAFCIVPFMKQALLNKSLSSKWLFYHAHVFSEIDDIPC
jgi:hypothetical protein